MLVSITTLVQVIPLKFIITIIVLQYKWYCSKGNFGLGLGMLG